MNYLKCLRLTMRFIFLKSMGGLMPQMKAQFCTFLPKNANSTTKKEAGYHPWAKLRFTTHILCHYSCAPEFVFVTLNCNCRIFQDLPSKKGGDFCPVLPAHMRYLLREYICFKQNSMANTSKTRHEIRADSIRTAKGMTSIFARYDELMTPPLLTRDA